MAEDERDALDRDGERDERRRVSPRRIRKREADADRDDRTLAMIDAPGRARSDPRRSGKAIACKIASEGSNAVPTRR